MYTYYSGTHYTKVYIHFKKAVHCKYQLVKILLYYILILIMLSNFKNGT